LVFGFDIDGVLTDDDNGQSNLWLERASAFFNRPILKHSFYIDEALGIAKEELEPFLVRETAMIMEIVSPRQGCVEVLTRLMDRGHEVQLITARSEPYREVTEDWLRRHKIPYTDLHMSPSEDQSYSKGQKCEQLGVQLFVDDHFKNCTDVAGRGIRTLLYHTSHNREQSCPPQIIRVYNWLEIAQHIAALTA